MASINDIKRMCKEHHYCSGCPLFYLEGCMLYRLPNDTEEIVDKWVAEHPVKTYAMDFFEKFPDAPRRISTDISVGIPVPCIRLIYLEFYNQNCSGKCPECWNREMKK